MIYAGGGGKGTYFCEGVCLVVGSLGERNNLVFRSMKMNPSEDWSLVSFHVSLWALVSNAFLQSFPRQCLA